MQYLVIGTSSTQVWTEEQLTITKMGLQQFQEDGRTQAVYGFAGENGGCLICDCSSNQELAEYLSLNPLSVVNEWETHPLVTAEQTIQIIDQVQQKMKQMAA